MPIGSADIPAIPSTMIQPIKAASSVISQACGFYIEIHVFNPNRPGRGCYLFSKRSSITTASARVAGASGSNFPPLRPLTSPSAYAAAI